MRPLFTIHAGEYLTGLHIQKNLKLNAWIPAKDIGIDLLVTDAKNRRAVSLQVKYGKDFLPEEKVAEVREKFRCASWFTLDWTKLNKSEADYWVFVLQGFKSSVPDFVIIPTPELRQRMMEIHGTCAGKLHSYLCTIGNQCWETRVNKTTAARDADGVKAVRMSLTAIRLQIARGTYHNPLRDFTRYLNAWDAIKAKLKA
jgi:hypothetical protein